MQAGEAAAPAPARFDLVNSTEYTRTLLRAAVNALQDVLALAPRNKAVRDAIEIYQAVLDRGMEGGTGDGADDQPRASRSQWEDVAPASKGPSRPKGPKAPLLPSLPRACAGRRPGHRSTFPGARRGGNRLRIRCDVQLGISAWL